MRLQSFPILLAAALLTACEQSSTTPSATMDSDTLPGQVFFGVHHVATKDGVRSSVLDGDTAYAHEGNETLFLSGVKLTFFTENGAESGTLTSRKGEYDPVGGLFVAREDVVLVTSGASGGRKIETDELNYHVKTDEIWSDKPFLMTQGGRTTRGSRFKSNGKFTEFNVTNAETTGGLPSEESGLSF